jgi:hypothetical protein
VGVRLNRGPRIRINAEFGSPEFEAQYQAALAGAPCPSKNARQQNGRKLVFGSGAGGFSGWGKSKERVDQAIAAARGEPLAHWTIHDLRRTAATGMANLGEMPHVIEAVLNHVSGQRAGVAGIYNRALYKTEKAQALTKWATHILALSKGQKSNVRPLRRA